MAHSALHFSLGMILGAFISFPGVVKAWIGSLTLSLPLRKWLLLSFCLGILAVLPGVFRQMGIPDSVCDGWWMNLCVFYPLLNKITSGGLILGLVSISFLFAFQYAIVIVALIRARRFQASDRNKDMPC